MSSLEIIKTTFQTIDDDAKAIIMRPYKTPNRGLNGVKLFALITTDYTTTRFFQRHLEPLGK